MNIIKDATLAQIESLSEEERAADISPIRIQYNDELKTIEGINVILIGILSECGESGFVVRSRKNPVSRVHCILFISSKYIYVMDPGSYVGIKTRRRELMG